MAVSERDRRELQEVFVRTIGPEHTDTLFAHLPPGGWGDVATRRDVEAAKAELRGELLAAIADLSSRMDQRFQAQMRWALGLWVTSMLAVVGMFVAIMFTR